MRKSQREERAMKPDELESKILATITREWAAPRWIARRVGISEHHARFVLLALHSQARVDRKKTEGGVYFRVVPELPFAEDE